jgi:hypothetical protein
MLCSKPERKTKMTASQVQVISRAALHFPLHSDDLAGVMPPSDGKVAGSVPGMQYHTKVSENISCITLAKKMMHLH